MKSSIRYLHGMVYPYVHLAFSSRFDFAYQLPHATRWLSPQPHLRVCKVEPRMGARWNLDPNA
ncbi:hypothetical protein Hanom_Chr03g00224421 [Helianthus anomalus]